MKTTIIALFCLLACGTAYGKHSHARHAHHPLLSRATSRSQCSLNCTSSGKVSVNQTWSIEIGVNGNSNAVIDIGYNYENNIIVSIHRSRNWAFAIHGSTGFVAWINLQTGGIIIVNVKKGTALFLVESSVTGLATNGQIDLNQAASVFAKIIVDRKSSTFSLSATGYVNALYKDYNANISAFVDPDYAKWELSFGIHLSLSRELIKNGDLSEKDGIIGFLLPNFDGATAFGKIFISVFQEYYSRTDGTFDGRFAYIIYTSVTANGGNADNIFQSFDLSIRAVGTLYADVNVAIAAYIRGEVIVSFNQKTIAISDVKYEFTFIKLNNGNWYIYIRGGNADVLIAYYKDLQVFLFYNAKQQIAVVISGEYGLFAVWNVSTGAGLIVKYTGSVLVVEAQQTIVTQFAARAYGEAVAQIHGQININKEFTLFTANTFNYLTLLARLTIGGSIESATSIGYNEKVRGVLIGSFEGYFAVSVKYAGVVGLIGGITEGIGSGVNSLAVAIGALFSWVGTIGGRLSATFESAFFAALSINFSGSFNGIFGGIISGGGGGSIEAGSSSSGSGSAGGSFTFG